ncbi:hypothetical protein AB6C88_17300, partial [Vibrio splendidus]
TLELQTLTSRPVGSWGGYDKLDYLETLAKNSYARVVLSALGFETSSSWASTKLDILNQVFDKGGNLVLKDVDERLETACRRLHICGKNLIQIISGDASTLVSLRTTLVNLSIASNKYVSSFPFEAKGALTSVGFPVLTAIEKQPSGTAIFFSTPKYKKIKTPCQVTRNGKVETIMLDEEVVTHVYEVVFVPNDSDRIELRISAETLKRDVETSLDRLREAFYDILRTSGVSLTSFKIVMLEKGIINLYNEAGYGKVIDTKFISVKNRTIMPRTVKRKVDICLRDQPYHKAGEKVEAVTCVGVIIQFRARTTKKNLLVTTRLGLECDPHSDYKTCNHLILENPIGNKKAIEFIDHLIDSNV